MSGLSLGTSMSNFKSVALTVFELLAFNSHWPAAAHTQTDRQTDRQTNRHTSNKRIISAIHFVHLAEIIIVCASLNSCGSKSRARGSADRGRLTTTYRDRRGCWRPGSVPVLWGISVWRHATWRSPHSCTSAARASPSSTLSLTSCTSAYTQSPFHLDQILLLT